LDPGSKNRTKEKSEKKFVFLQFFVATNIIILNFFVFLSRRRKNFGPIYKEIMEFFSQKIVIKLSEIWVWEPRYGIRKKSVSEPGYRSQKSPGSQIRIRNTATYQEERGMMRTACPLKFF
jgi:hypothetical protein